MSQTPQIVIFDSSEVGHPLKSLLYGRGWEIHGPMGVEACRGWAEGKPTTS